MSPSTFSALRPTISASALWKSGEMRLRELVRGVDGIVFSEALATEGAIVFAHACKLGLEGIVSKRAGSRYRSGTSRNWLKVLNPEFQRREGLG